MQSIQLGNIGSLFVISKDDAKFLYQEIFHGLEYLCHGVRLGRGDVVFDVGANIGLFSVFAHRACRGDLTLYAFEPIPYTFEVLSANLKSRELTAENGCHLVNLGLSHFEAPAMMKFRFYKNLPGNTTMKPGEKARQIEAMADPLKILQYLRSHNWRLYLAMRFAHTLFPSWIRKKLRELYDYEEISCRLTQISQVIEEKAIKKSTTSKSMLKEPNSMPFTAYMTSIGRW
jgi:FkbM family methyltransferase